MESQGLDNGDGRVPPEPGLSSQSLGTPPVSCQPDKRDVGPSRPGPRTQGAWGSHAPLRVLRKHSGCLPPAPGIRSSFPTYRTPASCWPGWSRRSRWVRRWRGWREGCRRRGRPGRCGSFQSQRGTTASCWTERGLATVRTQCRDGTCHQQVPAPCPRLVTITPRSSSSGNACCGQTGPPMAPPGQLGTRPGIRHHVQAQKQDLGLASSGQVP